MVSKTSYKEISGVSNTNSFNAIEQHTLDTNAEKQLS
jgi:HD superfamily phosphohydrolase YqeK